MVQYTSILDNEDVFSDPVKHKVEESMKQELGRLVYIIGSKKQVWPTTLLVLSYFLPPTMGERKLQQGIDISNRYCSLGHRPHHGLSRSKFYETIHTRTLTQFHHVFATPEGNTC